MENFTQISNKLIKHKELDCIEKMILINFLSYGDNIYPSITRICEELSISRPTCVKKIKKLKDNGYLKVTKNKSLNGDYGNNSYEVVKNFNHLVKNINQVVKEFNYGSKNNLPQVVKEINSNNTNKTILNNNIYYSSSEVEKELLENNKEIDEEEIIKNRILNNYSKSLIEKELLKLKNSKLNKLELVKELENNLKVISSNKIKKNKYSEDSKEYKLSILLRDLILERDSNSRCRNANIQSWSKYIDLLHRKDNRSYEDIENIIKWSQQDNFWKSNILSTQKLREKFDTLYQKYNSGQASHKNCNSNKLHDESEKDEYDWYWKNSFKIN
ncbi:hypothetical protein HMPREF1092_00567 [Clostridium thermobutyricum]|uniref:Uncharacterized protein n=1 Tax=Clostridium thermobutyricum TaxID=29372 RepID=N9WJT2_9CLOT|nr:MarR family transcriptional regulator [Clostridium thermobutyricum]ENZ03381.1 hypothetical protein HMPREF1092_00567 [Clostridium thermobutyricum]